MLQLCEDEMKRRPDQSKFPASGRLSVDWPPFAQKLAIALGKLEEDQFLILSVKRSNRFVQFAAQGSFGMRVETTSNSYLAKPEQLAQEQITALIGMGWSDPTGTPTDATPENDPDGSPNYFIGFRAPVSFDAVADLAVRTLSALLRVPHPGFLQYEAFDEEGRSIDLPELGLRLAKRAQAKDGVEDVPQLLLAALRESTGIDDLCFDADGEVGIRYGSALAFVRVAGDPPYVRIHSQILREVEESAGILTRLNDINGNETLTRFVFLNGSIFAIAEVCAAPFVSAHLAQALARFVAVADGMDSLLQAEFGGRTAFGEPLQSSMRH